MVYCYKPRSDMLIKDAINLFIFLVLKYVVPLVRYMYFMFCLICDIFVCCVVYLDAVCLFCLGVCLDVCCGCIRCRWHMIVLLTNGYLIGLVLVLVFVCWDQWESCLLVFAALDQGEDSWALLFILLWCQCVQTPGWDPVFQDVCACLL